MSIDTNQQELEHEEFDTLGMMLDWFKCEWGDDLDPVPNGVAEMEEDYDLEDIKPAERMSSEVV